MKGLQLAATMLATYAVLLVVNAILYYSWSGDASELLPLVMRIGGLALVIFGLWKSQRWAWWLALLGSLFFGLIGIVGVVVATMGGLFASRPYPTADYLILTTSAILVIGAAIVLLLPNSRGTIRKSA